VIYSGTDNNREITELAEALVLKTKLSQGIQEIDLEQNYSAVDNDGLKKSIPRQTQHVLELQSQDGNLLPLPSTIRSDLIRPRKSGSPGALANHFIDCLFDHVLKM
jgi:hypothetical protein